MTAPKIFAKNGKYIFCEFAELEAKK